VTIPLDRLDSFPEAWKPDPGEKLVGKIIGLDTRETEYGEYPIVTVLTADGRELAFHAFHTVARNELAKLEPDIGEQIGIAYHGRAEGGNYERYRILMLDRDVAQSKRPDWKAMRDEADEPPEVTAEPELLPDPLAGPFASDDDIPL
jgi:hypothetical protein